jgi:hypothetical protein
MGYRQVHDVWPPPHRRNTLPRLSPHSRLYTLLNPESTTTQKQLLQSRHASGLPNIPHTRLLRRCSRRAAERRSLLQPPMPRAHEDWRCRWCHSCMSLMLPIVRVVPQRHFQIMEMRCSISYTALPEIGSAVVRDGPHDISTVSWIGGESGFTPTPARGRTTDRIRKNGFACRACGSAGLEWCFTAAAETFLRCCCDQFEGSTSEFRAYQGHLHTCTF